MSKATAIAHANIAFIKHWGVTDSRLNLPANPSISMTLAALTTTTTVEFRAKHAVDRISIGGLDVRGAARARVVAQLDRVRTLAGIRHRAMVASQNSFPTGTGLASSAAAFAALSLAALQAAGLNLTQAGLSRLARLGSGSACRSILGGYVLWEGESNMLSYARPLAPPEHWDLRDVIAVVHTEHKAVSSPEGHALAPTSPFHEARVAAVPGLMEDVIKGIEERDLRALGHAIEADALAMHAVMMTSQPALLYWRPATIAIMQAVRTWREEGLTSYFTVDAGPNVHCLCEAQDAHELQSRLQAISGVEKILVSGPGPGVRSTNEHLF